MVTIGIPYENSSPETENTIGDAMTSDFTPEIFTSSSNKV